MCPVEMIFQRHKPSDVIFSGPVMKAFMRFTIYS